jgi:hypothetical protein
MTAHNQFNPPPQQSRDVVIATVIAIAGAVLLTMALSCVGVCAGIVFLARTKIESALEQAGVPIPGVASVPPDTDWNDWMVRRELTHFYQTALESVVTDKTLLEKLGEPVETVIDTDELFRRQDKGGLNPSGEHIAFDVQGPKGVGTVAVISATPRGDQGIQPGKITVTLSDGSLVDVPPLARPLPPVR